jgi:hypothetical protein
VNWQQLTDCELARHADLAMDPLTTTDLERELLRRFSGQTDAAAEWAGIAEVFGDFNIDHTATADIEQVRDALQFQTDHGDLNKSLANARALLDVLADFDIDTPEALRKQLDRLSKFDQAMQDLADPITTLQSLVTTE